MKLYLIFFPDKVFGSIEKEINKDNNAWNPLEGDILLRVGVPLPVPAEPIDRRVLHEGSLWIVFSLGIVYL